MKYQYNPPYLIKKAFSSFQWESKTDKILFTFDDGPIPETTPLILGILSHHNIKAAFFCVGDNISRYPDLYRSIVKEGHLVCNHTFNHKPISRLSRNETIEQIQKFNNLIKIKSGEDVLYFRTPRGEFNLSTPSLLKELNLKCVMWSLLTYDYQNDLNIVKHSVEKYLRKNSIIVLHDSLKSRNIIVESINYIAEEISRKGFQIGVPLECLR
jgi:peptidoglycan/xylan/chitin deacetylase (PgdA/CDA1 family)